MRLPVMIAALTALLCLAAPAAAVDFDKVDRHIAREPAYRSPPLYCLALLGRDARTRVWLVLDGERLYVDKNCNSDLTDDGPAAELKDPNTSIASFDKIDVSPDGGKTVYRVEVTLWNRPSFAEASGPNREPYNQSIHITFPDGRWFGAWGDHLKPLVFAARAQDAPVLHFGGDLVDGAPNRQAAATRRPCGLRPERSLWRSALRPS